MPKASVLLYLSKHMIVCLCFRQSVVSLEDIICTSSYSCAKENNEIRNQTQHYFLQVLLDK